jgi:hypothetical protein
MVSLLKSKKGGIPAVNEIVQIVMGVLPTPIKLVIFILLLTTIAGFVIPLLLGLFGYACVPQEDDILLYQVSMSKIIQKSAFDIQRTFTDYFAPQDYQFPEDAHPNGDKRYYRIPDECYVTREANGTQVTGYQAGCVDCDAYREGFVETYLLTARFETFCVDDGFDLTTLFNVRNCPVCEPKYPYYYNHTVCLTKFSQEDCYFTILNESLVTVVDQSYSDLIYKENIVSLGGAVRPQDSSEFVNVQCVDDDTPSLFIFSLELFNRTLWIFLIIGWGLITFATMWYQMTGVNNG